MSGERNPNINTRPARAFTLLELLVVIAIIGLLAALLVPTVRQALALARGGKSLSNLRQLAMGVELYATDNKGFLPAGAYPAPPTPRIRWTDAIWPYMSMREMYLSPQLTSDEMQRMLTPFAHDPAMTCGGYGYNYQYLGNGRHVSTWSEPYNTPFHARIGSAIQAPANTLLIADTDGTKADQIDNASRQTMASPWSKNGVYAIDPPLASKDLGSHGARRTDGGPSASRNYGYQGGADGVLRGEGGATRSVPGDPVCRATPAARNLGKVNAVWFDGHAESSTPMSLDDSDGDGSVDNGFWNGLGRADRR
jgi:prepilin-type N-terminal cleavage/methylation domain-containing protein/prepilin-type processing-associated H-X9-DG protein